MQLLKYTVGLTLLLLMFASCKKEGLMTYEGTNNVYFNLRDDAGRVDTGTFSFATSNVKDTIIKIPIAVMGQVAQLDRPCKVVVLTDSSTAVAGVHYDPLPDTFKIRAGKTVDYLLLKLHRTTDMQTKSFTIVLALQNSDEFSTNLKTKITNTQTGAYFNYIQYKLIVSDFFTAPKNWNNYKSYFGAFSRTKIFLMAQVLGVPINTLYGNLTPGSVTLYGRVVQLYLNEKAAEGAPIYDEPDVNGNAVLMAMGTSVQ